MDKLYKYMSLDYLEDAFRYGVYASKINQVNDLYESDNIESPEKYRIVCMANSNKKMLMWAYYVQHEGCCVEFSSLEECKRVLRPVDYKKAFIDRYNMNAEEIIESLYQKGHEWHEENEYRAVYYEPKDKNNPFWRKRSDGEVFLKLKVNAVYLGVRAINNKKYKRVLSHIEEYLDGDMRNVFKMKKKNNAWGLMIDRQFNAMEELHRL